MKSAASRIGRGLFGWLKPSWRTVRFRLTLLYGSLFLISCTGLLIFTNILIHFATADEIASLRSTADRVLVAAPMTDRIPVTNTIAARFDEFSGGGLIAIAAPQVVHLLDLQAEEFRTTVLTQRAEQRRRLLTQSGIALGVMAICSIGLGWIAAGQVLQPLRRITAAAQSISASNLHQRLSLEGPDDELKELGDTFDGLISRLEHAFEAQRQFIANASHELRTPLARQRTLIEVALGDPDATAESLKANHRRVLASGEQQERLIEALLMLARSERELYHQEPLDLADVTATALATAQPEIEQRELRLIRDLRQAPILGEPALIERMIVNLIENAARYNHARGTVEIVTGVRDGRAFFEISNTGPVVPPEEVERLFQPFKRLGQDRVRRDDGYGLGLSIVRSIARTHAADLRATARPDGGLRLEISFLPLDTDNP